MKTSAVIKKLQELVKKYGDLPFNIYKAFDKETVNIKDSDIMHDTNPDSQDIYIGIY